MNYYPQKVIQWKNIRHHAVSSTSRNLTNALERNECFHTNCFIKSKHFAQCRILRRKSYSSSLNVCNLSVTNACNVAIVCHYSFVNSGYLLLTVLQLLAASSVLSSFVDLNMNASSTVYSLDYSIIPLQCIISFCTYYVFQIIIIACSPSVSQGTHVRSH